MKIGQRKHIPGVFPVTTANSVYINSDQEGGSNKTLQDLIDNGGLSAKVYNFSGTFLSGR